MYIDLHKKINIDTQITSSENTRKIFIAYRSKYILVKLKKIQAIIFV